MCFKRKGKSNLKKKKNSWLKACFLGDVRFVKDIFYVIGKSFDKMHFTCNWVDLGWVSDFKKHVI